MFSIAYMMLCVVFLTSHLPLSSSCVCNVCESKAANIVTKCSDNPGIPCDAIVLKGTDKCGANLVEYSGSATLGLCSRDLHKDFTFATALKLSSTSGPQKDCECLTAKYNHNKLKDGCVILLRMADSDVVNKARTPLKSNLMQILKAN